MAHLMVNYGAGQVSVGDVHCAVYQLNLLQITFMKMIESHTLHFSIGENQQRCLAILAYWQMAIAEAGRITKKV